MSKMARKTDISAFLNKIQSQTMDDESQILRQIEDLKNETEELEAEERELISNCASLDNEIKSKKAANEQLRALLREMEIKSDRVNEIKEELILCYRAQAESMAMIKQIVQKDSDEIIRINEEKERLLKEHKLQMSEVSKQITQINEEKLLANEEYLRARTSMEGDIKRMEEKLNGANETGKALREKLQEAEEQSRIAAETFNNLTNELKQINERCTEKKDKLSSIRNGNRISKDNLNAVMAKIAQLEKEKLSCESSHDKIKNEADAKLKDQAVLESNRADLNEQIASAQAKLTKSSEKSAQMRAEVEALLAKGTLEKFSEVTASCNESKQALDGINEKLRDYNDQVDCEISAIQKDMEGLRLEIEASTSAITERKQKVESLKNAIDVGKKDLAGLKTKVDQKQAENEKKHTLKNAEIKKLQELQEQKRSLEESIAFNEAELEAFIQESSNELNQLRKANTREVADCESQLQAADSRCKELNGSISKAKLTMKSFEAEQKEASIKKSIEKPKTISVDKVEKTIVSEQKDHGRYRHRRQLVTPPQKTSRLSSSTRVHRRGLFETDSEDDDNLF